jgi:hypothetical protein
MIRDSSVDPVNVFELLGKSFLDYRSKTHGNKIKNNTEEEVVYSGLPPRLLGFLLL